MYNVRLGSGRKPGWLKYPSTILRTTESHLLEGRRRGEGGATELLPIPSTIQGKQPKWKQQAVVAAAAAQVGMACAGGQPPCGSYSRVALWQPPPPPSLLLLVPFAHGHEFVLEEARRTQRALLPKVQSTPKQQLPVSGELNSWGKTWPPCRAKVEKVVCWYKKVQQVI